MLVTIIFGVGSGTERNLLSGSAKSSQEEPMRKLMWPNRPGVIMKLVNPSLVQQREFFGECFPQGSINIDSIA